MMKNNIITILFILAITSVRAQFQDNMESYTDGEPIEVGHWYDLGCGGGEGCSLMSTSEVVHTGDLAGKVPTDGTTDAILDLGSKIFGHWRLEFWMYVPTGKEAFWELKGCVPICAVDWGILFYFNQNNESPGEGYIIDSAIGQVNFNFPQDTWFRVYMDWDIYSGISLATWELIINSETIIPEGTAFTNELGEIPETLGGINFYSISAVSNLLYLDNFIFCEDDAPPGACTLLGIDNFEYKIFEAYPNPVTNELYLEAKQEINSVVIYDILGQKIYSSQMEDFNYRIDMSSYSSGTYFVTVSVGNTQETIKVIK